MKTLIIRFTILLLLALPPAHAASSAILVGIRDGQVVARDAFDGSILHSDVSAAVTLQKAADLVAQAKGGKIELLAGTYVVDAPIVLKGSTTFVGAGKATRLVLGKLNAQGPGVIIHVKDADHCTLADFTCVGIPAGPKSSGVVLDDAGFATVRNVFSIRFSGYGIVLRRNFGSQITGTTTARNGRAGVYLEGKGYTRGGLFAPNKILGCYSYYEEGNAFEMNKGVCQDLVGCVAYMAKGHGIYMYDGTSNLISGNRIFMCYGNGIELKANHEMNVSSNICGWNNGINLLLDHCVWATVSGNEFIDSGGRRDPQYSVVLQRGTKSVQVSGNAIFNWWDNQIMRGGVYEDATCLENQITDNIVNFYKEEAVHSAGARSVAAFNLALPHAYGPPRKGPDVPNVKPEDIVLQLDIDDSKKRADVYFEALLAELTAGIP
jgi:parallel beta-helix repeat protein